MILTASPSETSTMETISSSSSSSPATKKKKKTNRSKSDELAGMSSSAAASSTPKKKKKKSSSSAAAAASPVRFGDRKNSSSHNPRSVSADHLREMQASAKSMKEAANNATAVRSNSDELPGMSSSGASSTHKKKRTSTA